MNVDYKMIGNRIKSVRKQKNLTQEKIAEALDVSVGYVSQVERGITKISLDLLGEISGILGCEISYLVSGAAVPCKNYLSREFDEQFSALGKAEKKLVMDFIALIKDYNIK